METLELRTVPTLDPGGTVIYTGSSDDYHGAHADVTVELLADGNYWWGYTVTNDGFWDGTNISYFSVGFSGSDPVGVSDGANDLDWYNPADGDVGAVWDQIPGESDDVYISPGGGTGDFAFTTAPAYIVPDQLAFDDSGGPTLAGPGDPLPAVSVAVASDAAEDGTDGTLEFTRSGDTSSGLTATYDVSGSATPGTDYTALPGSVSFPAGVDTVDVPVHALKDTLEEDDETVIATITGDGTTYSGVGGSATLTVIDTTLLPVALDFWNDTPENTPATVTPLGAVINLDSDALSVSAVGDASHGAVAVNADGTVTYTPDTGYVGDDSFTYTVAYATGTTTGTISYTVDGLLAPPFSVWTAPGTETDIDAAGAAYDPTGGTPTVAAVGSAAHGTVAINADGTIGYTPASGFTGDDSFTYTAEDAAGNQQSNTITVTVAASAPVALDADAATDQDTAVTVSVLDSAFNPAGGTLSVASVTQGTNGSVSINADGTVTYTPAAGYAGPDPFQYTVTDGSGNTATGTINVTVGPPPAGPTDEIDSDLAGIQTDLDDFDPEAPDPDQTAAAIQAAMDAVLAAVDTYVSNTTQFISTTNIEATGQNLPAPTFVKQELAAYNDLKDTYARLNATRVKMADDLIAQKNLIESLVAARLALMVADQPNAVSIGALTGAIKKLEAEQRDAKIRFLLLSNETVEAWKKINETYLALKQAYLPPSGPPGLTSVPDLPTDYDPNQFTPRAP